jgi:hypothetical protein
MYHNVIPNKCAHNNDVLKKNVINIAYHRYVQVCYITPECSYCNVYITHIFCKASLIPLRYDNICFIKNVSKMLHGNSC